MRKRWLSALFHAGCLLVILGGWMTSRNATSFTARAYGVPLSVAETPEEEAEIRALRSFRLEGDEKSIFVDTFEQENYPKSSMPKQWRSTLSLPNGDVAEASVNHPVRYDGWTIYQMGFGVAKSSQALHVPRFWAAPRGYTHMEYRGIWYPYAFFSGDYHEVNGPYNYPYYDPIEYAYVHGERENAGVYFTEFLVRRDPGVRWVFWGYGILVVAALLLAIRETRR
jgi:cytochrome c biogenesis protein ResB